MRALTVLSLILISTSAAAQRSDSSVVHLGVPQSIGEWAFAGRHDYPDPRLGVLVRYQRPDSLRVDVFAYPGPDLGTRCPLACAREVLDRDIDLLRMYPSSPNCPDRTSLESMGRQLRAALEHGR